MPKIPFYEQQTSVGSVRADPQAFGAGVAQATGEMGNVVADIGDQIMRRSETIEQAMLGRDLDLWGQESLTALRDTEDIMSPDTVAKYEAGLMQKKDELLGRFKGRTAARAALQASLENQTYQYVKSARAEQVKAQQQFIGSVIEQKANSLAISAGFAPEQIDNLMLEMDKQIDKFGDALSPQVAQQYKEAGRARLATTAISNLLSTGKGATAKALLQNPEIGKYLDPDTSRRFVIDIAVDEGKAAQAAAETQKRVRSWTVRLGRDLTPAEVIRIESMPDKKDMTVADQIAEYELITGKPAPQNVVDDFYKLDGGSGAGGAFGNSLKGRALSFVNENAVGYANGLLSPEEARKFEIMVTEAYSPVERVNPQSGLVEKFTPTMPNFVSQALSRGSRTYGGVALAQQPTRAPSAQPQTQQSQSYQIDSSGNVMGGGNWRPGDTVYLSDNAGSMIGEATVGPDGNFKIVGQGAATPQPQGGTTPATRTIWQRRKNIVGPIAAVQEKVYGIPGIGPQIAGNVFGEAETRQAKEDRAYVENASNDLVRVLQNNPKFAEGERKAIEKEISISPEFWSSASAFESKLEGINQALQDRLNDAQRTLQGNISLDERKRAMDNIEAIKNFRLKMGMPVVIRTEEEAAAQPPGTLMIDTRGNEFIKR